MTLNKREQPIRSDRCGSTSTLRGLDRVCTVKDSRVGVLDIRAVRAVRGRVHKLLDNLFLVAFFPMVKRRTKLEG